MIQIDKNVPIPVRDRKVKNEHCLLPFEWMEVGDSFFMPNMPKTFSAHTYVRHFNRVFKRNICILQRREGTGVRVWRTF